MGLYLRRKPKQEVTLSQEDKNLLLDYIRVQLQLGRRPRFYYDGKCHNVPRGMTAEEIRKALSYSARPEREEQGIEDEDDDFELEDEELTTPRKRLKLNRNR